MSLAGCLRYLRLEVSFCLYLNLPPPKENMFPSKFVELDLFKGIAMETEVEYLIF